MGGIGFDDLDAIRDWYARGGATPTDAEVRALLEGIVTVTRANPVFEAYVRRGLAYGALTGRGGPPNTEGWHALGELRCNLLVVAMAGLGAAHAQVELGDMTNALGAPLDLPGAALAIAGRLMLSQPYLWTNTIDAHICTSPPLPPHTISRELLPYPIMYWSLQSAKRSVPGQFPEGVVESNWMLLTDEKKQVTVTCDLTYASGGMALSHTTIPYGARWPDDFAGEGPERRILIDYALKSLAFLASPYVATNRVAVPRAFRRAAALAAGKKGTATSPLVNVVVLREPLKTREVNDDPEWDGARRHHWWVTGHYRAQWYPSQQAHKVIWIAPHLQGDLSKPLLERVYKVAR
jgi:hypothetical protein